MKKWHVSLMLSLALVALLTLAGFDVRCDAIRAGVLRLHILANSDSAADQALKLAVRDGILAECGALFAEVDDVDAAILQAEANLPALQAAARRALDAQGSGQSVAVRLAPADFETRTYDDVTLPAGEYMAVEVVLGAGKGHNWWCVCYPNLCIPAASQTTEVGRALDTSEAEIVTNAERYEVRFWLVDCYQRLKQELFG